MQSDLDLAEIYRRLMAAWLWVVGAAVVGGLLGLLASYARPPLYQATAVVAIGIEWNRADVRDDITIRQAFDRVRGLLLSDEALQAAISLGQPQAGESMVGDAREALRARIRLSERPDGWVLAVVGADPLEAERMAQAWAEIAVEQMRAASQHALRAAEWQDVFFEASCRLVSDETNPGAARWLCRSSTPSGDAGEIPAAILAEVEASRGILPVLTYSLLRGSDGTARPILWTRGSLVLAGAVVGMFLGGMVVAFRRRPSADGGAASPGSA